ncbi:MAG: ABC transporter permease [Nanoarchaeota archaeon]|nr:ABC transporter permease [Nanoarchaeota archaeon]
MIKKLLNEIIKNLKVMFRNKTSLSLLIIAPLIFILLVGYAFSNEDISGAKIGVISEEEIDLTPLSNNLKDYGVIIKYSTLEECQSDLILQKIHLCIGLENINLIEKSKIENFEDIPTGKVTFYYDNTRKKVSLGLIKTIKEIFGLTSEQISIETTETIIENIQSLVGFLNERKQEINEIKNESIQIKIQLIERKEKLEIIRDNFMPQYLLVKDLQNKLHNYSSNFDNSTNDLLILINDLTNNLEEFQDNSLYNESLDYFIGDIESQLSSLSVLLNSTTSQKDMIITTIDDIIISLDNIKIALDEEIAINEEYINKIDQSVEKVDELSQELDNKLNQLSGLSPDVAKKLVKPILYNYNELLENSTNIQLSFPQLLVIIIMFLTLLFSNVSTLTEIHNKAHLRNLIAPVNDILYIVGMLITSLIIILLQINILFVVAQIKLNILITPIFFKIILITILLIIPFILLGMIFAYLSKTVQSSILITTFVALLFFLFSNALFPIEIMPSFARIISNLNPLVIGEYLIKEVQLFNMPLNYLIPQISLIIVYIFILFLILIIVSKNKNKKER